MTPLTLIEKCRLVAYYGDISEANRRRWQKDRARKTITEIMSTNQQPRQIDGGPGGGGGRSST